MLLSYAFVLVDDPCNLTLVVHVCDVYRHSQQGFVTMGTASASQW